MGRQPRSDSDGDGPDLARDGAWDVSGPGRPPAEEHLGRWSGVVSFRNRGRGSPLALSPSGPTAGSPAGAALDHGGNLDLEMGLSGALFYENCSRELLFAKA